MPSMTAASTSPSSPCNPKASTSTSILFSILSSSLRSESGCAFRLLPKLPRRLSGDGPHVTMRSSYVATALCPGAPAGPDLTSGPAGPGHMPRRPRGWVGGPGWVVCVCAQSPSSLTEVPSLSLSLSKSESPKYQLSECHW
jgi:hypothetical protein